MLFKDLKAGDHFLDESLQPIKDSSGIRVVFVKLATPVPDTIRTVSDYKFFGSKPFIFTAKFVSPIFEGQLTAIRDETLVTKLIM